MRTHRIALIPGDGIGREVIPAAVNVLDAVAGRTGFALDYTEFDYSCERWTRTGRMMPDDGLERLGAFDSIFLGAVGHPDVPDHVSLWGLLIPIRRTFAQYVNLRPVRLLKGLTSPLRGIGPDDIDFCVVRENNEGEYSEIGDILSDLGPAVVGGMGVAAGGNINPERTHPSMFEPVHGSAPDIAGQGIANPIAAMWTASMMLDHLEERDAAAAIMTAVEAVTADGSSLTRDLGGDATSDELSDAVLASLP